MGIGRAAYPPGETRQVETLLGSGSKASSVLGGRTGFTPCERVKLAVIAACTISPPRPSHFKGSWPQAARESFWVSEPSFSPSLHRSICLRQKCSPESLESELRFCPLLTVWEGRGPENLQVSLTGQVAGTSASVTTC